MLNDIVKQMQAAQEEKLRPFEEIRQQLMARVMSLRKMV